MYRVSFFNTKPYDKVFFNKLKDKYDIVIDYHRSKLTEHNVKLAEGSDAVVAFVNDTINDKVIDALVKFNIKVIAMRCAGFNNVDLEYAKGKVVVLRVPAYSPYSVAEHNMGLLLSLNRKLNRAYNRTREFNFSLNGLTGFDLHGKTIGIIGTGKIGRTFIDICKGFKMNIIAYDLYPIPDSDIKYVDFNQLCEESDIISLHCPLTPDTYHLIDENAINRMKDGVFILNTSRGGLIDSEALLKGLINQKIGAAGLDVYEDETDIFYEDYSNEIMKDEILARLISMPNVFVTSHQAFLTEEALVKIAEVTLENLYDFFHGNERKNEVQS
ncbi:MAG: 2-hydroxyacid dehydrogenase [Lachnospiraceae bacterium]|nr:2-hydroxyacid dehydrogenase [Lachnospiraceae bacterium]